MVTPRFFPDTGGVETHVAAVASRLAARGHSVTVLATDITGELPPRDEWKGVSIERERAWPRRRDYYFSPGIYRRVRDGGWDLVHVQSYHTFVAPLAMAAARSSSTPYVVTFHGGGHSSKVRESLRGVQFALLRPLLAGAAGLVALTESELDANSRRLRLSRDRFVLVPNGSDLPARPRERTAESAEGLLVASIGRLERYKGHQHVISALPAIRRERPDARLWVAGSGPYRDALERLADRLGVADAVEIRAVAAEDRAGMADELSRVDVVVLASERETHPIAVLEGLSLGCRAVVADSPGLRELGEQGLARVVSRPERPEELARAVLDEADAPPRRSGTLRLSTWDECASRLDALYASIAS
jgi:glycosyltransferase involved in cell wall biosynthesis